MWQILSSQLMEKCADSSGNVKLVSFLLGWFWADTVTRGLSRRPPSRGSFVLSIFIFFGSSEKKNQWVVLGNYVNCRAWIKSLAIRFCQVRPGSRWIRYLSCNPTFLMPGKQRIAGVWSWSSSGANSVNPDILCSGYNWLQLATTGYNWLQLTIWSWVYWEAIVRVAWWGRNAGSDESSSGFSLLAF